MIPSGTPDPEDERRELPDIDPTKERATGKRKPAKVIDLAGKLDISKQETKNSTRIVGALQVMLFAWCR